MLETEFPYPSNAGVQCPTTLQEVTGLVFASLAKGCACSFTKPCLLDQTLDNARLVLHRFSDAKLAVGALDVAVGPDTRCKIQEVRSFSKWESQALLSDPFRHFSDTYFDTTATGRKATYIFLTLQYRDHIRTDMIDSKAATHKGRQPLQPIY